MQTYCPEILDVRIYCMAVFDGLLDSHTIHVIDMPLLTVDESMARNKHKGPPRGHRTDGAGVGTVEVEQVKLKAPFPYFGGKASVADVVWRRFGNPKMYVEPFCGSAAMLLARPCDPPFNKEIINDYDGNVANFWRAMKYDPDGVADVADWPVNHIDLMARKRYVLKEYDAMREKLIADPEYCDAKIAGYWAWALSVGIGETFTVLIKDQTSLARMGLLRLKTFVNILKGYKKGCQA